VVLRARRAQVADLMAVPARGTPTSPSSSGSRTSGGSVTCPATSGPKVAVTSPVWYACARTAIWGTYRVPPLANVA